MVHVAVTTTLPVLDCPWLEKVCKGSTRLLPPSNYSHEKRRRSPSTTSDATLISASPPHSPSRCKRRSWLPALGTSVIPLFFEGQFFEYLGHLVDAVLFTQPLKTFPKGNFCSLGKVHEGLLHCTLQTPVLADSPLLHSFTRE